MERSLNAIENWFRGTRFLDFKETFADGRAILSDAGSLSYRGPGSNKFLYSMGTADATNLMFEDMPQYRAATTFNKTYPICGTDGYFSLKPANDPEKYLIAVNLGGGNIVARSSSIDSTVDMIDSACWRELSNTDCPKGQIMLENKKFPGLVMFADNKGNMVRIGSRNSDIKQNCWEKSPANTTLSGRPKARQRTIDDMEIRRGWNLSDNNISWGPEEQRSYELQPQFTRTAEECAQKATENPKANGFVFLGYNDVGNCKTKVGGYWNENRSRFDIENHARLTSGKF